jgi:tripartite-type tricarboxylate transporter receptor subunit TctC
MKGDDDNLCAIDKREVPMKLRGMWIVLATALIACGAASAQDWPARPITMVVPYAAGGPTDVVGRLFAQQMGEVLGRQIVVENVPGAGGMTGANRVAHAKPDGHQVLFGGSGNLVYNQALYKKPLFDSLTDFTPVALLTEQSLVLVARRNLPVTSLSEFARHLKTNTGASFGSAGAGSSTHLGCVMLNLEIGVNATHVPYRGIAAAHQDMIGGRIDYICDFILTASPHIQASAVKAIAILSPSRSSILPGIPTAEEQGISNIDTANWYGILLPKGASSTIVQTLHDTAVAALDAPPVRARLRSLGVEAVAPSRRSPDYFARFLRDDIAKWTAPIKASGVTAE